MTFKPTENSFQGDDLPELLLDIMSIRFPGQLSLSRQSENAAIYFGRGRITGAICGQSMGSSAVLELLHWDSGQFEFLAGEPCISERRPEAAVTQSLTELLSQSSVPVHRLLSQSLAQEQANTPHSSKAQAGVPSQGLFDAIERLLKRVVGPFGGVLLEDAAEEIGCDIEEVTAVNFHSWLQALKELVPAESRTSFERQMETLLTGHH